jgi:hypothetical protein
MGSEAAVPWSIVMLALVVRLVGVFLVLVTLGLGIQVSGAIVSRLESWRERSAPDG